MQWVLAAWLDGCVWWEVAEMIYGACFSLQGPTNRPKQAILDAAAAVTGLDGWVATLVGGARRGKVEGHDADFLLHYPLDRSTGTAADHTVGFEGQLLAPDQIAAGGMPLIFAMHDWLVEQGESGGGLVGVRDGESLEELVDGESLEELVDGESLEGQHTMPHTIKHTLNDTRGPIPRTHAHRTRTRPHPPLRPRPPPQRPGPAAVVWQDPRGALPRVAGVAVAAGGPGAGDAGQPAGEVGFWG